MTNKTKFMTGYKVDHSGKIITYDVKNARTSSRFDYMIRPVNTPGSWQPSYLGYFHFTIEDAKQKALEWAKNDVEYYKQQQTKAREVVKKIKSIKAPKVKK